MIPIRDINPTKTFPIVTLVLIAVNLAVFAFVQPHDSTDAEDEFLYKNAAIACEVVTWEPVSQSEVDSETCSDVSEPGFFADKVILASIFFSLFLHGSWLHVLFNMWFLWIFGNNVEEAYGPKWFLFGYLGVGLLATLGFVAANPDSVIPLVGASGAVAGVLGAYLVLFPKNKITSLVIVFFVPIPAFIYLGLWFVSQFADQSPNVAWEAHVAGFLVGVLVTLMFRTVLIRRLALIHKPRATRGFPTQIR